MSYTELDQLAVNTIRFLAVDAVQQANSGHPGMPMGAAPMAYVLWTRFLRHNPRNPEWPNRDRFVLSAGHGSMLLYALLHLTGYDLSLDEIRRFRQWGSKTPGHPEYRVAPGIETTTGPLGQGFANGVGMAIAERHLAALFNRPGYDIVDHYTYAIVSDGDLMEGISSEAASLAGHLGLGRLIYLYDDNDISIDGSTNLTFTEDVAMRFHAYGWHVLRVADGNDLEAIEQAIAEARQVLDHPSLIIVRTHIGYGSPHKQDTAAAHGEPLGEEEVRLTKRNLGWPEEPPFYVPGDVAAHMGRAVERGDQWEREWRHLFARYADEYPEQARLWEQFWTGTLPDGWDADLPTFEPGTHVATRAASGNVLDTLAPRVRNLIGGSADLTPSNKTKFTGATLFHRDDYSGRYLHFGVREHAMGAILNGMAYHGGLRPYGGTFLVFSDYMRPAIRLAALSHLHVIYVFTHDSIWLGEDGPTHQPVEHLASLRAMPNLVVIRPGDANEVVEAWRVALTMRERPVALVLSRQKVNTLDRTRYAPATGLRQGAYVLAESHPSRPDLILIATGSEVPLAAAAYERLADEGLAVRLVSMPSWELFAEQDESYRHSVLPPDVKARLAVEAGATLGWERWVGEHGRVVGIDHFGASAPYTVLMEKLGFTVEHVVNQAKQVLNADQTAIT
ncbi:MAG: transketolase [Ardenticatenia bacterium]|nr:transketolase [Ardenticatenia bacterium]